MAVWKRYLGKKVVRGDKNYNKATWIAHGKVNGQRYNRALPKESIKTAEDARAEDDRIRAAIRSGVSFKRDTVSFISYIDDHFLPYWQTNYSNYGQKVSQCRTIKAFFKKDQLQNITPSRCEEFKRWRMTQNAHCQQCEHGHEHICKPSKVTHATVNCELSTLRRIFERARADRRIKENPMDFVPNFKPGPPRERYLTDDERSRLMQSLPKNLQRYAVILTAFLTGWRRGQVLSLRKQDIDPSGMVYRPAQKRKPRLLMPVHPLVHQVLSALAEMREDWLFINPSGKRLVNFDPVWAEVKRDANLHNFRFHDLRHNAATELLNNGTASFAIQHALGHSRQVTTQGYAHVKNEYLKEALGQLNVDDIPRPDAISTPIDLVM